MTTGQASVKRLEAALDEVEEALKYWANDKAFTELELFRADLTVILNAQAEASSGTVKK